MSDTVIRAFELPVQVVEPMGAWETLRECWSRATDLANWCVFQLARHDVPRMPGMQKLEPMPQINGKKLKGLYGLASETFGFTGEGSWWAGACISAATICRDVEKKYKSERLNTIWHRNQALCTYRYPYPWPVHAQAWRRARLDGNKRPCIEICLPCPELCFPDGGVGLRLRGGPEFGRQMGLFHQVVKGDLPMKQLAIREHRILGSSARPNAEGSRVMVKMVAELPAREAKGEKTLTLFCDKDAFWVASLSGRKDERQWTANYDRVRMMQRWLDVHDVNRQRLVQTSKMERRCNAVKRRQWQDSLDRACVKQQRRMSSWLHEITAHVVGFCLRQRVKEVVYDDSDRFSPGFPWFKLNALLADKLKAEGITLHTASIE